MSGGVVFFWLATLVRVPMRRHAGAPDNKGPMMPRRLQPSWSRARQVRWVSVAAVCFLVAGCGGVSSPESPVETSSQADAGDGDPGSGASPGDDEDPRDGLVHAERGTVQLVVGTEVLVEDELLLALRSASVPGDDCTECTAMALVAVTVGGETTLVDLAAGGLMAPQIDEQARTAEVAGWWLRAEEFGNGELTLTVDRTPPKG